MIDKEEYDKIVKEYYEVLYNFCYSQLRNIHAAQDCTQETFYIFLQKSSRLYNSDKIIVWLYNTAGNVIKRYRKEHSILVSIEDVDSEIIDNTHYFGDNLMNEMYRILNKDEADLLIRYFNCDHGERKRFADELGISLIALYKKAARIRKKLSDKIDEEELLTK